MLLAQEGNKKRGALSTSAFRYPKIFCCLKISFYAVGLDSVTFSINLSVLGDSVSPEIHYSDGDEQMLVF
jgi:hypothetical protein